MRNRTIPVLTILLLAVAGMAFAQTPAMIVEYYENNSGAMYVRAADGAEYDADQFGFGEELPTGATLVTLDGDYAELKLEPNGTIIRVAENTNFTVNSLQGRDGAPQNTFSVAVGKLRAVVAKSDGARYQFRGATGRARRSQFPPAKRPMPWPPISSPSSRRRICWVSCSGGWPSRS
jgi:hypothetical protein